MFFDKETKYREERGMTRNRREKEEKLKERKIKSEIWIKMIRGGEKAKEKRHLQ